ncbi:helicase-associated domain-containing protein [Nocardioides sp. CFH 31398]|uniref:helicase-associated domain-containing protein n=1 Tax=Nocardioides sp. CFH 31398 TaxID=2919579 RepID=UPI001F054892|nr:helicase-associated domain-containing protein [Nocardioides sp. CFH 31398]MCH1867714.1 helicase-associated domain-containing protein [Nocardioides sp. CFH 31398]
MSSSSSTAGRTLADRLRAWPDERLVRLLTERADLGTPVPADSGQLASRAATRTSLLRALDLLTHAELLVLDALVVLGQTSAEDLVERVSADPAVTGAAAHRLVDLALVWEAPGGLRPLAAVTDLLTSGAAGPGSGLRPVSADPLPPATLAERLAALSPEARALADHVDAHGGRGTTGSARRPSAPQGEPASPVEELLAAGVLVPAGSDAPPGTVELPGEVGLALRGGRTTREPVDAVPALGTTARDARRCEQAAVGAATEAVRRTEQLCEAWGADPPVTLRSGGLAVRDLRATATLLGVGEADAAVLVEVAAAAGLLAVGTDLEGTPAWLPTPAYDAWSARDQAQRWTLLAATWLSTSRVPGLVGGRDHAGKAWNALVPELSSSLAPETRRVALAELAGVEPGLALADEDSLVERLRWVRPRRPRLRDDLARWALREAAVLGVAGLGALPPHGRALVTEGVDAAAARLEPLLPVPVEHVLLQADLTAVAPGPLAPEVARELGLVADVESSGGATVYRFTPASVRRALDAGWAAADVHAFVGRVSATPVPQPLTYLVDDAARTHGRVRAGRASSFLRADDETALAELLSHPRAGELGLRRLAPTVVVSDLEVEDLVPALRQLGAAPVVEGADGSVHVVGTTRQRAKVARTARTSGPGAPGSALGEEHWAEVARAVRAGDEAARHRPTLSAPLSPSGSLAALRDAVETGATVTISYVDSHGARSERLVRPRRVEGGTLTAWDHRADDLRTFAVHRITAVRRADAS